MIPCGSRLPVPVPGTPYLMTMRVFHLPFTCPIEGDYCFAVKGE